MSKKDELKKIAYLARLEIKDNESDSFFSKILGVLDYMKKVQDHKFLKKEGVVFEKDILLRNDDVINTKDKYLIDQFIEKENNLLKVKKVL
ncbi:MAG: aspartyl/glutamyl-tRNA amidotransferase subunit C [Patescibacteria group bacterium]|nr:aspartyl/glutamyl-tRNA amidotransferase subunit C [Patescibacteria group bacterium]MDD4304548.1 aspartyl/glutamyl-tRNA amidotransferase subunit C [Patescibacteria group bacterium]MDD4695656.1 aspartyl/glutamyl-tRNA amidotransferase subunit C [Patescibacteria group bacterium]